MMADVVQLRDFERKPSVPLEQPGCHVVPLPVRSPDADLDKVLRKAEQLCEEALRQTLLMYCEVLLYGLSRIESRIEANLALVMAHCVAEQAAQKRAAELKLCTRYFADGDKPNPAA
jgi:hypothetical protein